MNIFDGLYGYEKLMLVCGFTLFVFALVAITVLIVKNRDFKAAMGLFVFAILLMGFPGIQAVKISHDMVELDNIRQQPQAPTSPAQQQQAQDLLANLEERAASTSNPQLQAKVADGYRAIGNVDKAYQLAQPLLRQPLPAQVRDTLVPVLTAKLDQILASKPVATAPASGDAIIGNGSNAAISSAHKAERGTVGGAEAAPPPPAAVPTTLDRQRELATVASQLQSTGVPLPAASHVALAKAYSTLGRPQQAQSNVEAARRLDPTIRINPTVLHAAGNRDQ